MSERANRAVRGGLRALTGIVVVGVAAAAAVLIGATPLPSVTRAPVSVPVDTVQGGERALVCAGSFAELGADQKNPGVAVPAGGVRLAAAGEASSRGELERERSGGSAPAVLRVPATQPFAAAQSQSVETEQLRGLAAQSCAEPVNEQWLVGGTTAVGASATVNLGNPSGKPATVQLTVFDEAGQVDSAQTSGVLVPAGSERIVSLNGYAPGRDRLAVRVVSTGAAVTASLGLGQVDGLQSLAVDVVTRQLSAETTLVVPGVASPGADGENAPGDVGYLDEFPVLVRALSATGQPGTATVRALLGDGSQVDLGRIELGSSAVGELSVDDWPRRANAVVIEADVPIVGGVRGAVSAGGQRDLAWFAPAPELPVGAEAAAAVIGGQLVLANAGEAEAEVTVSGSGTATQTYRVPAGGAIAVQAAADSRILSDQPVHAGVRIASGGDLAGYPVLAEHERTTEITVYPR